MKDVTELKTDEESVEQILRNMTLVGQTELRAETSGLRAVLEYPIKTLNVIKSPVRYQVDTGALIVPDFSTTPGFQLEHFDVAHVAHNKPDKGEFFLRIPRERRLGLDYQRLLRKKGLFVPEQAFCCYEIVKVINLEI